MTNAGKMSKPPIPEMKTRKTRLATVTRNIKGQMCRITVASFGSGSDLSLGLKIRYDLMKMRLLKKGLFKEQSYYLAAPHDKLKTEMQSETIWVVLTWPVLSAITIC